MFKKYFFKEVFISMNKTDAVDFVTPLVLRTTTSIPPPAPPLAANYLLIGPLFMFEWFGGL